MHDVSWIRLVRRSQVSLREGELRRNIDLFERLRHELTVNLGTFIVNKEICSAYCLLLDLLTSLRVEFIAELEELLSFFTCYENDAHRFLEHVKMAVRYLDSIIVRGNVRVVGPDPATGLSKVITIRLDNHDELNHIIHSMLAILHCVQAVLCNDITSSVLSASVNECFLETLNSKISPNWAAVEDALNLDTSPSFLQALVKEFAPCRV